MLSQVALTTLLVSGATVLTTSLLRLQSLDLGIRPQNIIVAGIGPLYAAQHSADALRVLEDIRTRMVARPDVESAALSISAPFLSSVGVEVRTLGHPLPLSYQRACRI